MNDSYQAIYDAVRSRISGGDIGHVIERVAMNAFDLGHTRQILQQEFCAARGGLTYRCSESQGGSQPMTLKEALELVVDLAAENTISHEDAAGDPLLRDCLVKQLLALGLIRKLIAAVDNIQPGMILDLKI